MIARQQTPPSRRWLAHLVRAAESTPEQAPPAAGLPPFDTAEVLTLARREQLAPLIHVAVVTGRIDAELPEAFLDACEADYYETLRRNVFGLKTGRRVLDGLRRAGVDAAPLDAWPILDGAIPFHRDLGARPLGELELIVRESRRQKAQSTLEELGFRCAEGAAGRRSMSLDAESAGADASLRLHWRWDPSGSAARPDDISGDQFIDGLCDTTVSGRPWATRFAVLASAALCAARQAPDNWLQLADIHRIVTVMPMDWDAVVESARRWRVTAPVYAGLVATRDLIGTPVPAGVLDRLAPGPVRRRLLHRILTARQRPRAAARPPHLLMAETWWELARAAARAAAARSTSKPLQ